MKKNLKKNNNKKICAVITARTSYTKMKSILLELKNYDNISLKIICAASAVSEYYGNLENQIKRDKLKVNFKVNSLLDEKSLNASTKSVALAIIEFSDIFKQLNPDLVIVMADRYEIISPVIAASYQNIPIGHIQGGEITGNIDEKVRHAVSKFSDYHFPATRNAYRNLIKMGENKNNVFLVGCPSIDIAKKIKNKQLFNFDIYKKYKGVGDNFLIKSKDYLIIMYHPDTNHLSDIEHQAITLILLIKYLKINIYWFWPNADAGSNIISKIIRKNRETNNISKVHFFKNMEPEDFLILLNNSKGIIGNSSTGIRESSYLGIPSINIGTRQEGRERHNNVLDVDKLNIKNFTVIKKHLSKYFKSTNLYGSGKSGKNISKIISKLKNLTYKKKLII